MAARQGSGRPVNGKRNVSSPSFKKEDRNLSVRFVEPDRVGRRMGKNSSSRGHVLLPNKVTRPKTCGPTVPHVPRIVVSDITDNNPVRPSTSGNKVRRPSLSRVRNSNIGPFTFLTRADTPTPEIVLKSPDQDDENLEDDRSDARRALHLPPMRNRARSVPNVLQVSIPEDSSQEQEDKPSPLALSPGGNRSVGRRGSINISTDRLLRDLAHGIQHAELQEEEPEPRWSAKQQNDWDQLKSCRYLRFSKRYQNEMEKEVDPFSS